MMQAYLDDSGSHRDSHNCVVAGYFGGINEWRRFERKWKPILDSHHISEFHARRFWARDKQGKPVGEYAGWSPRKLTLFLDALLRAIEDSKVYPLGCGVIGNVWKSENINLRRVLTGATRTRPTGAPSKSLFLGFLTCVIRAAGYCKPGVNINFVFDENPATADWASICYSELKRIPMPRENRETISHLGELTFSSSIEALPLQAADLIAYEAHQYVKEANGDPEHKVNGVYFRALRNFRSLDDFWLYDERRLTYVRKLLDF